MKQAVSIALVNTENKGRGIVAKKPIGKAETIFEFPGELVSRNKVKNPNAALQLDEDLFLESDGTIDESLNHSCNPNCYVDFTQLALVALKDIHKGEELTFDYNTSEYDLVEQGCSFKCLCGSRNCVGEVKGFKYLPEHHKRKNELLLSPFLKKKWKQELYGY
jgi:SET domain-containing protein